MFGCFLFCTDSAHNFVGLHPAKSVWLVRPVLLVCDRPSKSLLLPLVLGSPPASAWWGVVGWLPRHLRCTKKPKLNHVVTSYGDCTSDKFNCDCHGACGGDQWLVFHGLEFWEVCCVFLKKRASFMSLSIELSCAVYMGYVRAGLLPVQQDRDYSLFVAWKLIFVCCVGGSIQTEKGTNGDQEVMCSL